MLGPAPLWVSLERMDSKQRMSEQERGTLCQYMIARLYSAGELEATLLAAHLLFCRQTVAHWSQMAPTLVQEL